MQHQLPHTLFAIYAFILGALTGSFLNVVILRLPKEQSIVRPRSHCPYCKHVIPWYDNIPLISFLFLRARCRFCGARIAWRYPLVELSMALLSLALLERLGLSWQLVIFWPVAAAFLAIVFLDIDHFWVPDILTIPCALWLFLSSFLPGGMTPIQALLGLLPALGLWLFAVIFTRLTGKEGMGFGDIKLLGVIGLAHGPLPSLLVLFLAALLGSMIGGLVLLVGGHKKQASSPTTPPFDAFSPNDDWQPPPRALPFGPFLILGAYVAMLFPEYMNRWPQWLHQLALMWM